MVWHRVQNFRRKRADKIGRIYITGTGRAGTTFLMQLLTELAQDTGFADSKAGGGYFSKARAGLEKDIFDANNPVIVKSPFVCDHVDELLARGFKIRRLVIPVREMSAAAASRVLVQQETTGSANGKAVAGGLWGTDRSADQEVVLLRKFSHLIEAAARNDIPMTFLGFPRMIQDPDYLYRQLAPLLFCVSRRRFMAAFHKIARPDLVHEFK